MATDLIRPSSPEENQYTGVWYKTGLSPPNGVPAAYWLRKQAECCAADVMEQPRQKRVGNQEGFDLLDRETILPIAVRELRQELQKQGRQIEDLEKKRQDETRERQDETRELSSQISSLEPLIGSFRMIRMRTLEERRVAFRVYQSSRGKDAEVTRKGNQAAHSANILADIDTIQYVAKNGLPYLEDYRSDFLNFYSIPFEEAAQKLSTQQPKIIQIFDDLARHREMNMWNTGWLEETTEQLHDGKRTIIAAVRQANDMSRLALRLEEGGDLKALYDEICGLFIGVNAGPTVS